MADDDVAARIDRLSPDKQALLRKLLADRNIDLGAVILPRNATTAPLSHSQEQLWFLERLGNVSPAYNEPFALALTGALDVPALARSLDDLIARHAVFRTVFRMHDGQLQQVVQPHAALALEPEDVADDDAYAARATEVTRAPFDLAAGPLYRARLFRLGNDRHVLLIVVHHILADLWSMASIAAREIAAGYAAHHAGRASSLPPLPIQFGDYAHWERARWDAARTERELGFWRRELAGVEAVLELPTDRTRPRVQSFRGERVPIAIDPVAADGIRAIARAEGATLFMALLAAYQIALHRYSGQSAFCVAAPIANRLTREAEQLIGYFINLLPMRADLTGEPTFRDIVRRVRATAIAAYAHQDTPFDRILQAIAPERTASMNPLAQVGFVLQNAPVAVLDLAGLRVELLDVDRGTAKFDLLLQLEERAGALAGFVEYSADLFDRATIDRLIGHLVRLCADAGARPDVPIAELELLSPRERDHIAVELNATDCAIPDGTPVGWILARGDEHPARVAVTAHDGELTYGALGDAIRAVARRLAAAGVRRGDLVGVACERGVHLVPALLGVQAAGAAYVPLDPQFPRDRLAFMIEDAQMRVVIADDVSRAALPTGVNILPLVGAAAAAVELPVPPTADDLAYVLFTSGSTGRPKGVQIGHRALANFLAAMRRTPGLTESDVLCAVTSISFDIAGLELYLPLVAGARVHVARAAEAGDAAQLLDVLSRTRATVMQATPVTWQLLVEGGWDASLPIRAFIGGEALPPELARAVRERASDVWNLYGPTETTIWSTACAIDRDRERISIGAPIANTRVYILDRAGHVAPLGVAGELVIAGDGLSRGYLARPELTAERFVTRDIAGCTERVYRTGDVARWTAAGELEFLGRGDQQIKLRGFRIELGEIESALERIAGVTRAIAVVAQIGGDPRIIAYTTGDGTAAQDALKAELRAWLPDYMIPSTIVRLDKFPLTPNGKIDRNALPEPRSDAGDADGTRAITLPRTDTERAIHAIWRELLGVERVGVDDNFFELGGHSLLLARAHAALERTLDRRFAMVEMLRNPTIGALASYLDGDGDDGGLSDAAAQALRDGHNRRLERRKRRGR